MLAGKAMKWYDAELPATYLSEAGKHVQTGSRRGWVLKTKTKTL